MWLSFYSHNSGHLKVVSILFSRDLMVCTHSYEDFAAEIKKSIFRRA